MTKQEEEKRFLRRSVMSGTKRWLGRGFFRSFLSIELRSDSPKHYEGKMLFLTCSFLVRQALNGGDKFKNKWINGFHCAKTTDWLKQKWQIQYRWNHYFLLVTSSIYLGAVFYISLSTYKYVLHSSIVYPSSPRR